MRLILLALCLAAAGPAQAQTVYPSMPAVPLNLLRVSIVFDAPQPADLPPVTLTAADGREIEGAFYPQRLWSPDGTTLTLYLDPGRVKTGLILHDRMGAVLRRGEHIALRLGGRVLKRWTVGPARNDIVTPRPGTICALRNGSREPVEIAFAAPIDWQGRTLIAVAAPNGTRVAGAVSLLEGERRWRFVPALAWRAGTYAIRLHPDLEDPEGNRMTTRFEIASGKARAPAADVIRRFTVR